MATKEQKYLMVLDEAAKLRAFRRVTCSMAGARERWAERARTGMTNAQLAEALQFEIGVGGTCDHEFWIEHSYMNIWVAGPEGGVDRSHPTFSGAFTIKTAREVYGIADPSIPQLGLFGGA